MIKKYTKLFADDKKDGGIQSITYKKVGVKTPLGYKIIMKEIEKYNKKN